MLAFIDESGDAGMKLDRGSSPYFCIVAVVFKSPFDADSCDRTINGLRLTLRKPAKYEFHFSKCPDSVKLGFLKGVADEQFDYHAFVIDKAKLFSATFDDAQYFYEFAVNLVCENAGDLMTGAKVVINKNGNREFLQRLQSSLRRRTSSTGVQIVKKIAMQDSKSNDLVQLADMTCGAVARSVTASDNRFRDILRKKGRERRVQQLAKVKSPQTYPLKGTQTIEATVRLCGRFHLQHSLLCFGASTTKSLTGYHQLNPTGPCACASLLSFATTSRISS